MNKHIISAFSLFVLISLILMPSELLSAASNGIDIWLFSVFPSLFPFMVSSSMLVMSGAANFFGKLFEIPFTKLFGISSCGAFALFTGLICGYPMGAKSTSDLYKNHLISAEEANLLLSFTMNAGPAFMLSAVSVKLLNAPETGYIMLISTVASNIISGIIICHLFPCARHSRKIYACSQSCDVSKILSSSISSSLTSIIQFGGYIVFFSVVTNIFNLLGIFDVLSVFFPFEKNTGNALLTGVVEMTGGLYKISLLDTSLQIKASLSAFILSFGGFCVQLQAYDFFKTIPGSSFVRFSLFKLLNGSISAFLVYISFSITKNPLL